MPGAVDQTNRYGFPDSIDFRRQLNAQGNAVESPKIPLVQSIIYGVLFLVIVLWIIMMVIAGLDVYKERPGDTYFIVLAVIFAPFYILKLFVQKLFFYTTPVPIGKAI